MRKMLIGIHSIAVYYYRDFLHCDEKIYFNSYLTNLLLLFGIIFNTVKGKGKD